MAEEQQNRKPKATLIKHKKTEPSEDASAKQTEQTEQTEQTVKVSRLAVQLMTT